MLALGSLYFPELYASLHRFDMACDAYHMLITKTVIDVMKAQAPYAPNSVAAENAASQVAVTALGEAHGSIIQPLHDLDKAAARTMAEIIASTKSAG
jgi:hypothetical protein